MKSAVESLNPTRVKLSVEVPFDELKPSLDAAYKKISQQISVPGFRKGRVPTAIIDQRVGRNTVLVEAVNDALPELYSKALDENDITPLSRPELQVDDIADGTTLAFTAELDVLPKIELPEYHGLEASVEELSVKDSDVDEQLENLRQRFGTLHPVERPAQTGDFVTIDLAATKDGEPITDAQAAGMSYQIGSGTMLEGLDGALDGLSAGEEATFESTLVGGEYRDQPVDVTVKVTAVKEQELPELDDEFAQTASEFDTVEELRADLRDQVTRSARLTQAAAARDAVLEKLLSVVDVPLPDGAVEDEKSSRSQQLSEQLSYAGMSMTEFLESEGQTPDEFDEQLDTRVREAMVAQFVLDQIAQVEQMGVDESDLTQQLMRRAQQAGVSPEQYVKLAMDNNHLPEIIGEVRRGKALAHLVESAVVKDGAGNVVELAMLLPDGTYAEPPEAGDEEEAPPVPATDAAADVVIASDYVVMADEAKQD